jgi:phage tail protein X
MAEYLTGRGEVLDQIVLAQYGRRDVLVAVLDANPGLAELGPILPYRTRVTLPDLPAPSQTPVLRLWGRS